MKHSAIVQSLAEFRALMKKYPSMIFRTTPFGATADERREIAQMNIQRLFP
jgi:hypothetical protein